MQGLSAAGKLAYMHKLNLVSAKLLQLRHAACPYRFRVVSRTNKRGGVVTLQETIRVYSTADGAKKSKVVKGCSVENEQHLTLLTDHLLAAGKELAAGGRGLDWDELGHVLTRPDGSITIKDQTWGEVRAIVKNLLKPGGIKSKDSSQLTCFKDGGYFAVYFDDDAIVTTEDLRLFATSEIHSLKAHKKNRALPITTVDFSSRGYHGKVEMISCIRKNGVKAATKELHESLKDLKRSRKPPEAKFIPRDDDIEEWLDALQSHCPLKAWCAAMLATYPLRPHELWHIQSLPGQDPANPSWIEITENTKTGARAALPCPEKWVWRYKLNDISNAEVMLQRLKEKHPIQIAENSETGELMVVNNKTLGGYVSHWFSSSRACDQFAVTLQGWRIPKKPPGALVEPDPVSGRCTAYCLRHRWALRAKQLEPWSDELKAAAMGHDAAIHRSTYLSNKTLAIQKQWMQRQKGLDENKPTPLVQEVRPAPEDQTIRELERKLAKTQAALQAALA